MVAGPDGTVAMKRVEIVGSIGANWAVSEGLADGDQVIVAGIQRAAPGMKVTPKVEGAPAEPPPAAAAAGS